jgi:hypothetical protein
MSLAPIAHFTFQDSWKTTFPWIYHAPNLSTYQIYFDKCFITKKVKYCFLAILLATIFSRTDTISAVIISTCQWSLENLDPHFSCNLTSNQLKYICWPKVTHGPAHFLRARSASHLQCMNVRHSRWSACQMQLWRANVTPCCANVTRMLYGCCANPAQMSRVCCTDEARFICKCDVKRVGRTNLGSLR